MTLVRWQLAVAWLVAGCGLDPVVPVVEEAEAGPRLAEATCRAQHDCACPSPTWPDRATCLEQETQRADDAQAIAAREGLQYDGACAAALIARYDEADCDAAAPGVAVDTCPPCRRYVGTGQMGEACERLAITIDLDTCGQGLRCEEARCVPACDPPPVLVLGDRCRAGIEDLGGCEPGTYCGIESDQCEAAPVAGEPCPETVCDATAVCDRSIPDAFVCVARGAEEDSCSFDAQCLSAQCVGTRCTALAATACFF
jgi:hypothetical protein